MNRVKTRDRSNMSPRVLDAHMRVILNGVSPFDPREHTIEYLKNHDRCDVPSNVKKDQKVTETNVEEDLHDEDIEDNEPKNQKLLLGRSTVL